jgi:hypothetical protein
MSTTHRIAAAGAVILSLAAAGAPTASALPDPGSTTTTNTTPASVYSRQDKSMIPATSRSTSAGGTAKVAVVRLETPRGGFDWGDAGIGAAAGVALALLGLGGALVISQRPQRTRQNTAQPN